MSGARLVSGGPYVVAALLALAGAAYGLSLGDYHAGEPLTLDADAGYVAMQVRAIHDHGWYWFNPDLGAPFGQQSRLFPDTGILGQVLVHVTTWVTGSAGLAGLVVFVAGFVLAALSMTWLARTEGLSGGVAALLGIVYACAPKHFELYKHLWLSHYWVLPLGIWLALRAVRGRRFEPRPTSALCVAAVALSNAYYTIFVALLVGLAAVVGLAARRRLRPFVEALVASALCVVGTAAIIVQRQLAARGMLLTSEPPGTRGGNQSAIFSGTPLELFLPWSVHRVDPLARWATDVRERLGSPEQPAMGLVAVVCLLVVLAVAGRSVARRRLPAAPLPALLALTGIAFAIFVRYGVGAVFSAAVAPQIRTWSRAYLIVMALVLLVGGVFLDRLLRRVSRPEVRYAVLGLVLVVALLDQTNPGRAVDPARTHAQMARTAAYVRSLERQLPAGCAVFQLPVVPFPEPRTRPGIQAYAQLDRYAVPSHLRWSMGAMRGTAQAEWQLRIDPGRPTELVRDLAATGFCAVEVDRSLAPDAPDPRPGLTATLGAPIATMTDGGDIAAYRIPPRPADPGHRHEVLTPALVWLDPFRSLLPGDPATPQVVGPRTALVFAGLRRDAPPVPVTARLQLRGVGAQPRTVSVVRGATVLARAELAPGASAEVSVTVDAVPGPTGTTLVVDGPPAEGASAVVEAATASTDVPGWLVAFVPKPR